MLMTDVMTSDDFDNALSASLCKTFWKLPDDFELPDDHDNELEFPADIPFSILLPAFVTSELKTAFQIGFMIFLPFLIIDLVVASTLMALGMMMLSPTIISMPFKLLLFVLVDGWALTMGSLAGSFAT